MADNLTHWPCLVPVVPQVADVGLISEAMRQTHGSPLRVPELAVALSVRYASPDPAIPSEINLLPESPLKLLRHCVHSFLRSTKRALSALIRLYIARYMGSHSAFSAIGWRCSTIESSAWA